ncbi:cytochrome c maturation protein CcmE [Thiopseudomonas acetoxidans]|uniref:Cytochrome c-type biogenesis protein CcmE n=1 Tax=Thiopseudomonas acetoxidans TaxID=3041622 RepID=A0ABT7SRS6_9GAMM|nr:cytochrome c maturation protein CcmE [Thiopseudomonas sp. CY1220]MDM7858901.1 cytochrome c maturation protein CcmE [Thiopseudomonas sp. CY1220]
MNPVRKKRLIVIFAILAGISATLGLGLYAMQQNINLFYTPTEIASGVVPQDARIRAGGLVKEGSVKRNEDALTVTFVVTDGDADVTISYRGILPDLFREGQGIVALGRLNADLVLESDEVLAKHDENYMPPEVGDALAKTGMLKHYEEAQGTK